MIGTIVFGSIALGGLVALILGPSKRESANDEAPLTHPGEGAGEGRQVCSGCGQTVDSEVPG